MKCSKSAEHITVKGSPVVAYTVGQTLGSLASECVLCSVPGFHSAPCLWEFCFLSISCWRGVYWVNRHDPGTVYILVEEMVSK